MNVFGIVIFENYSVGLQRATVTEPIFLAGDTLDLSQYSAGLCLGIGLYWASLGGCGAYLVVSAC